MSASEFIFVPEDLEIGKGFLKRAIPRIVRVGARLVLDIGLSGTPPMGHLGCLASHLSVPVTFFQSGLLATPPCLSSNSRPANPSWGNLSEMA